MACLIKEIQVTSELRRMAEIELVAKDVIDNLIVQKFEAPLPKCQDDDDPFIKGEFDVVKELLEKVHIMKYTKINDFEQKINYLHMINLPLKYH